MPSEALNTLIEKCLKNKQFYEKFITTPHPNLEVEFPGLLNEERVQLTQLLGKLALGYQTRIEIGNIAKELGISSGQIELGGVWGWPVEGWEMNLPDPLGHGGHGGGPLNTPV